MGHYVYRYVDNDTGEILYVGKNDTNLINRINQHKPEAKFQNLNAHVEYIILDNPLMTRFCELYYINKWKPRLNVADKYDCEMTAKIDESEYEWLEYKEEDFVLPAIRRQSANKPQKADKQKVKQDTGLKRGRYDIEEFFIPQMSEIERQVYFTVIKQFFDTGNREIESRDYPDTKNGVMESEILENLFGMRYTPNGVMLFDKAMGVEIDGKSYVTGLRVNTNIFSYEEENYKKLCEIIKSELNKYNNEGEHIASQWIQESIEKEPCAPRKEKKRKPTIEYIGKPYPTRKTKIDSLIDEEAITVYESDEKLYQFPKITEQEKYIYFHAVDNFLNNNGLEYFVPMGTFDLSEQELIDISIGLKARQFRRKSVSNSLGYDSENLVVKAGSKNGKPYIKLNKTPLFTSYDEYAVLNPLSNTVLIDRDKTIRLRMLSNQIYRKLRVYNKSKLYSDSKLVPNRHTIDEITPYRFATHILYRFPDDKNNIGAYSYYVYILCCKYHSLAQYEYKFAKIWFRKAECNDRIVNCLKTKSILGISLVKAISFNGKDNLIHCAISTEIFDKRPDIKEYMATVWSRFPKDGWVNRNFRFIGYEVTEE